MKFDVASGTGDTALMGGKGGGAVVVVHPLLKAAMISR